MGQSQQGHGTVARPSLGASAIPARGYGLLPAPFPLLLLHPQRRYPLRRQLNQGIIGSDDILQDIPVVMGSAVGAEYRLRIPARGFFPTVPAPIFCAGPGPARPWSKAPAQGSRIEPAQ